MRILKGKSEFAVQDDYLSLVQAKFKQSMWNNATSGHISTATLKYAGDRVSLGHRYLTRIKDLYGTIEIESRWWNGRPRSPLRCHYVSLESTHTIAAVWIMQEKLLKLESFHDLDALVVWAYIQSVSAVCMT
ncbi:hypothetical protein PENSUB_7931 [Penicillium subrubescens]|uniref:Uncharacterized protein n=1 Tax=Penicillium subrubescens TaxID=1316194 RepID=A0A1Q5TJS6_9EURO|nr:hypothetical protein PENSUB_7931 [Penicillium subrubescens]